MRAASDDGCGVPRGRPNLLDAQHAVPGRPDSAEITGLGYDLRSCRFRVEKEGETSGPFQAALRIAHRGIDHLESVERSGAALKTAEHGDGSAVGAAGVCPGQVAFLRNNGALCGMVAQDVRDDRGYVECRDARQDRGSVQEQNAFCHQLPLDSRCPWCTRSTSTCGAGRWTAMFSFRHWAE